MKSQSGGSSTAIRSMEGYNDILLGH